MGQEAVSGRGAHGLGLIQNVGTWWACDWWIQAPWAGWAVEVGLPKAAETSVWHKPDATEKHGHSWEAFRRPSQGRRKIKVAVSGSSHRGRGTAWGEVGRGSPMSQGR